MECLDNSYQLDPKKKEFQMDVVMCVSDNASMIFSFLKCHVPMCFCGTRIGDTRLINSDGIFTEIEIDFPTNCPISP